ncbi:bifunctional ornithine acetyltransferase/N-acetylglutamate synthase [Candidatus Methanocrinis natronophilus]|uniref:Glutamate N-acetyltransferase n=1 Tax=Candidatus Methanocrinis natronophilus TaxID=3033396 RepID=A0ABT5X9B2_9EURY|nr:bifunctional ornithine acetyltransferase/N-acetylglutamate synthase [Candidatus Methanocrinis natronophilus]MDF0591248.1 bifunctional ornithine acetyltransferase/N-acetylglutamate synthase [Candidatus Methanocrinis natronophilus]
MKRIEGGICAVGGVRAAGARRGKYGVALIAASGTAAGVFTTNRIRAAPLDVTAENLSLSGGRLEGVIANSGSANAYTGARGAEDARWMAGLFAETLGVGADRIGVASTGVIGRYLDRRILEELFDEARKRLRSEPEASGEAASAIMTTDTRVKEIAVEHRGFRVAGITKGAGMIEPNMATMLAFLYTDARISPEALREALLDAADESFNMLIVDGDTSTNDLVLVTATGKADADPDDFREALTTVCVELAKMMAKDGEGATKLVEMVVTGALDGEDARLVAKTVMRSSLVKTALFGCDPNWGRIVAAAGRSGAEVDPEKITLSISTAGGDEVFLVRDGKIVDGVLGAAEVVMRAEELLITLHLGLGEGTGRAFGCDLSYDYVKINADYTT